VKATLDILIVLGVTALLFLALAALGCVSNSTKPDVGLATFDTFERELVGAVDLAIGCYLDTVSLATECNQPTIGRDNLNTKIYDFGGE